MKITVESKLGTCAFDCGDKETLVYPGLRQYLIFRMNVRRERAVLVARG